MSPKCAVFALLLLTGWESRVLMGQPPHPSSPDIAKEVKLIELAASRLSKGDLEIVLAHESSPTASIAILAAWRRCQLKAGPTQDPIARFVGFLEAKSEGTVPQWLVNKLYLKLSHRTKSATTIRTPLYNLVDEGSQSIIAGKKVYCEKGVSIVFEGESCRIAVGGDAVILRSSDVERLAGTANQVFVLLTEKNVFFAPCSDYGSSFELSCFERGSGTLRWTTEVWADRAERLTFKAGGLYHYATITASTNTCCIAGYNGSLYFETFRVGDGRAVAHWSSSYWNAGDTHE